MPDLVTFTDPELADVFAEARSGFIELVRVALETTTVVPADPSALARVLVALTDGLMYDRLIHPRTAPRQTLLAATLADMLRPPAGDSPGTR